MVYRNTYKTQKVVDLTGFSADLLRAWKLRYHLLQPERTSGGHRLYTEDDLRVLRRIRSRMEEGQTIGEIAQVGRLQLLAEDLVAVGRSDELLQEKETPADQLEVLRTTLLQSTLAMNGPDLERTLSAAFALYPTEVVIHQVMEPVAITIGDLWAEGQCNVAAEHFFSQFFAHQLRKLIEVHQESSAGQPRVICACLPEEEHEIGLLTVAYQLVRLGYQLIYLGPNIPLPALEWACDLGQPRAIFLSVSQPETLKLCRRRLLQVLERRSSQAEFFLGGRGLGTRVEAIVEAGGQPWPMKKPLSDLKFKMHLDRSFGRDQAKN